MRILLIEDDEVLVKVLIPTLMSQHYAVDTASDGQTGWDFAQSADYDLILIDVGLPRLDGISLCQRLRSEGCSTPILLMTAKNAASDRIRGLDAGADDYLNKPLDLGELQARVRALLRRREVLPNSVLQIGALRLDSSGAQVSYQEKLLKLTPKEYSLLELFLRSPTRVFSRGQIVDHLWSFDDPPLEESVKAHIKGLRQKLKEAGAGGWIENVYGIGYRLSPKDDSVSRATEAVQQQYSGAVDKLWYYYQDLIAKRVAALQTAAQAAQTGTLEEMRQAAGREAHKLAGVLGMFEREDGTKIARKIEQLLEQAAPDPTRLAALVQSLTEQLALSPQPSSVDARLLLIDSDFQLGEQLQQLAQASGIGWKQMELSAAQDWLQSQTPELVVLSLSGHQDLALLAELAARTPPIPVLVLASADELLDRVRAARAGASSFLVKPVTAVQVWDIVRQLLQRQRSCQKKVLVVDDDPLFLAALRPILEPWGIKMVGLDDPQRFWEVLQVATPDLLVLDIEMPKVSGIELCQAVRTDPDWQGLPILFLTAHRESETIGQVFAAGADDYVTKPIVGPELLTRMINRLERAHLREAMSSKDPQTGLANQPHSSRNLEKCLHEAENRSSLCLAILKVAPLHRINVRYGHATGNNVLRRWSHHLQAMCPSEILGYWGNGEFTIGLIDLSKEEAQERLAPLLLKLRQQVYTAPDGNRFQAECSWAIAEYPTDGQTLQSLYQAASTILEGRGEHV